MRTHLMAGTALVAATMLAAGGAAAQDKKMMKPSISVNGYYEGVVGGVLDNTMETKHSYKAVGSDDGNTTAPTDALTRTAATPSTTDNKTDTSALDTKTDAEIHFNGRATLDSGMKIHMRVELEGQNNHSDGGSGDDPIDEYFMSVSGSFGRIILGGTGGAPVKMLTGLSGSWATGVGETLSFDVNNWLRPASPGNFYQIQHSRLDTGDAEKVTYISPKLGGFQVGMTYSPNRMNNDDNSRINAENSVHDGIEGAVSYIGKFGDVGFGVGGGMIRYAGCNEPKMAANMCDGKDMSDWLVAARIDFAGGFRAAVAHKRVTDDNKMNQGNLTDAGVRFVQGANSFSLVGVLGEMKNTDASYTAVMGSYARALGPGVKWHANVIWMDSESAKSNGMRYGTDGTALATQTDAGYQQVNQDENSGIALVTGIKVVF